MGHRLCSSLSSAGKKKDVRSRRSLEKTLGKSLEKCDVSDNMRTCELEMGEKRTLMLMAEDNPKSATTLLGCYYYYEK